MTATVSLSSTPTRWRARSTFSTITDSGSESSTRNTRRIMSMTGWNGIERPNDSAWPCTQVALRPSCRRSSCSSRDLPMPGSPTIMATWP